MVAVCGHTAVAGRGHLDDSPRHGYVARIVKSQLLAACTGCKHNGNKSAAIGEAGDVVPPPHTKRGLVLRTRDSKSWAVSSCHGLPATYRSEIIAAALLVPVYFGVHAMNRPTTAVVFGILNLAFFGMGLCGIAISIPLLFVQQNATAPRNPMIELMQSNAVFRAFNMVSVGLGLVGAIVLCVAGIGLLLMRNWGRLLSIGYSIYTIVMGLVAIAVNASLIWLPLLQRANEPGASPQDTGMAIGAVVGGAVGGCLGMLYPIVLLIFMLRPAFVTELRSFHNPANEHPAVG